MYVSLSVLILVQGRCMLTTNGQVLPMVGSFIFVRPELLPGFLIKLNVKN
jgi:hypothetical protein